MDLFLASLTTFFLFTAFVPYVRDMLRGTTKPERASWFIWAILGSIALSSQYAEGAQWSLVFPTLDTFFGIVIFGFSIKYGMGGFTRRDKASLGVAAFGLLIWYITSEPLVALIIVIAIDAAGSYLTVTKAYEAPESETMFSWVMTALAGIPALLAVGDWSFALAVYPVYIVFANASVPIAIYLGKKREDRSLRATLGEK
ncbi:hypothetical protein BH11PAT4_BH11PAT4_7240 [soil metagenome]